MIDFKVPQLEDAAWIDPIFLASGYRSCEYTFTNLITWAEAYEERVALVNGFVVVRVGGEWGCYTWPAGQGDKRPVIVQLYQDAQERGLPFCLGGLTGEQYAELDAMFPGKFTREENRDGADYCYTVEKLAKLSGKKLHAKRNHIHRFEENFPDWTVKEISPENFADCFQVAKDWETGEMQEGENDRSWQEGESAMRYAFDHYDKLGLEGLILYGGGKPLAFTMGRTIGGDTYDVMFEKAYWDVQGAYPMINREFARWVQAHHPEIVYMNREDDMGKPNLRKAKLSYYPDLMVEKLLCRLREGETL